jgi:RNA polymerase sigma-70 factor (ECF subfamily)
MHHLAHWMLDNYPALRRYEQTDDVVQRASLKLWEALRDVTLDSSDHFHNLAAQKIRQTLLDLVKHYCGPKGEARNRYTDPGGKAADDPDGPLAQIADVSHEPQTLAQWGEFHEAVEELPEEERAMFDLLWYEGLTQAEAARVLGVCEKTIQRRWRNARGRLGGEGLI